MTQMLDRLIELLVFIGAMLLILMMAHITLDVTVRAINGRSMTGTLEIVSYYYMIGLVYLPLAYIQKRRSHIDVDLFIQFLHRRFQGGLKSIMGLALAIYCAVLVWSSARVGLEKMASYEYVEGPDFLLRIWPSRWIIPIGFAVMGLVALLQVASYYLSPPEPVKKD